MNWKQLAFALVALSYHCMAAALAPCHLPGLSERVECGVLTVPEDRANPTGRGIAIDFARIPSSARPAASDPLLVLAVGQPTPQGACHDRR